MPVYGVNCNQEKEIVGFRRQFNRMMKAAKAPGLEHLQITWTKVIDQLAHLVQCAYGDKNQRVMALAYLEGAISPPSSIAAQVEQTVKALTGHCQEPLDIAIADFGIAA